MINKIDHSFAILVYRESKYLEECIISLKNQSLKSHIYLSTSTPSEFVYEISKKHRLPLIINNTRNNIAADWSFAYEKCDTKFLTLTHQDDIYFPNYTAECLRTVKKNSRRTLITFSDYFELIDDRMKKWRLNLAVKKLFLIFFIFKKHIKSNSFKNYLVSLNNPISCPTVMFNKVAIGEFSFSEKFSYVMDWEAWLRLGNMNGSFCYINKRLMAHRIHSEAQTSIQIKDKNRFYEEEILLNKIWPRSFAKALSYIHLLGSFTNRM